MRKEMPYKAAIWVLLGLLRHMVTYETNHDLDRGMLIMVRSGKRSQMKAEIRGSVQGNKFVVKIESKGSGRTAASPEHFAFMIVGHYNSLRVNERTFTAVARNALI